MGWLKDLADEVGVTSFRSLAAKMETASAWPGGRVPTTSALGNQLAKLDAGKQLSWCDGKGKRLLPALAEALRMEPDELREHLERAGTGNASATVHFAAFPRLRALDLAAEDLMPGTAVEQLLHAPKQQQQFWWAAAPGAGKTIVGQWLQARQRWNFLQARTWEEVELPERGSVYVELEIAPGHWPPTPARAPNERICVAAPSLPGSRGGDAATSPLAWPESERERTRSSGEWTLVQTPPPREWIPRMIAWTETRVRSGGRFNAQALLRTFPLENLASLFSTPGELLAFLGRIDETGLEDLVGDESSKAWRQVLRAWWRTTVERTDRGGTEEHNLHVRAKGASLLIAANRERLRRGLAATLPAEAWATLVVQQSSEEASTARLDAVALSREIVMRKLTPDAIVKMLSTDGTSIVATLRALSVLRPHAAGELALQPAWVATIATELAAEDLAQEGWRGVGALLLHRERAATTLNALCEAARGQRWQELEACVAGDEVTPEALAAIDGAVRAIGFALAAEVDVPLDLVERAWRLQEPHRAARYLSWPPIPIVSVADSSSLRGPTSRGAWFIAALAITRKLTEAGISLPPSSLSPWQVLPEEAERDTFLEILSSGLHSLEPNKHEEPDEFALLGYRLGGDLLARFGPLRPQGGLHEAQEPDALVLLVKGQRIELPAEQRERLLSFRWGLPVLEDACKRHGVALDDVLRWCWSVWGSNLKTSYRPRDRSEPRAFRERVWRLAPAHLLSGEVLDALEHQSEVWPWLSDEVWARWLDRWDPKDAWHWDQNIFRIIPPALAIRALRNERLDTHAWEARRIFWSRFPERLLALVDELSIAPPTGPATPPNRDTPFSTLVYSAPPEHTEALIDRAETWLAKPQAYPGVGNWLPRWLLHVIAQRSPGWRRAFALSLRSNE